METLLFTTQGTTNLSLNSIHFAMDGVDNFMDTVMGIDSQDFLLKMEGYAIQGIKVCRFIVLVLAKSIISTLGSAKNHQQHVSQVHSAIHDIINKKLSAFVSFVT